MGKLNIFEISLSSAQGVYYSGQLLQGHVTVELHDEMKMRGVRLQFYGGARVHWSERHTSGTGKNRRTVTRHYSSSETYFNNTLVLFGKAEGQSGENPVLAAGRYTYPFQFQIPPNLPSSFEGTFGRVRYSLNGTIDKPWKFDHTTKRAFTVVNLLDLNQEPQAMQGARGSGQKTLCCLCCESGPISANFQLDRLGYVPGENIPIKGEIINHSNRNMAKSFAVLMMTVRFHATTKSRTITQTVSRRERGLISKGDSDIWNSEPLPIPPLPPSRLPGCRIIDVDYAVKFCVDPAGPAFNLEIPLGVLIGSIPLQSVIQQFGLPPPPPAFGNIYGEPDGAGPSAPPPLSIPSAPYLPPDMPPPTYAESVFGKVNIKDDEDTEYTKGSMEYAPVYTYYNWGNNNLQQMQRMQQQVSSETQEEPR